MKKIIDLPICPKRYNQAQLKRNRLWRKFKLHKDLERELYHMFVIEKDTIARIFLRDLIEHHELSYLTWESKLGKNFKEKFKSKFSKLCVDFSNHKYKGDEHI